MNLVAILAAAAMAAEPATAEEKTAAAHAHMRCLLKEAARLDDGVSDATSIARGIHGLCSQSFLVVKDLWGRGLLPRDQLALWEAMDKGEVDMATRAVLEARRDGRAAAKP